MNNEIYLSVVIPAYNEEKRIPGTLVAIDKYLRSRSYGYEIVVVSDGSKDRTAEVVRGMASEIANLRLIDNKENHGKGFVVRQGLSEAKGKYRLFTDADNSTSVDQFEKMVPWLEKGFDVVIGSRDAEGAVLDPPQPLKRRILGDVFRLLTQIMCGTWSVLDSQCGFKCLTDRAAGIVLPKCRINRFAFDPEILVVAKKHGLKIKEIPIIWKNDLDSKVNFKGMIKMLIDLFVIRINLIKRIYDK